MNPESEQFDRLRRLLALKRHEMPPPGYFDRFSGEVMARVRGGEGKETLSAMERLFGEAPWVQRIWASFESKPVFAGAFGAAVCGLLISGIVYSERVEMPSATVGSAVHGMPSSPFATVAPVVAMNHAVESPDALASTNPIDPSLRLLFEGFQPLEATPVQFAPVDFHGGN